MTPIVDLAWRGGPVMVPIIFGSVVALAVFIARMLALRASRVVPPGLVAAVRASVQRGQLDDARAACAASGCPLGRVLAAGLDAAGLPRSDIKERMEEVGRVEAVGLERHAGVVGAIATIEPLLGLLGTVTGMISVFQGVVTNGVGDPAALAGGIWEALITTAAGLVTGIPAYLGWKLLISRAERLVESLETGSLSVLEVLAAPRAMRADGGSGPEVGESSERPSPRTAWS